jgi:hypothetical protein
MYMQATLAESVLECMASRVDASELLNSPLKPSASGAKALEEALVWLTLVNRSVKWNYNATSLTLLSCASGSRLSGSILKGRSGIDKQLRSDTRKYLDKQLGRAGQLFVT